MERHGFLLVDTGGVDAVDGGPVRDARSRAGAGGDRRGRPRPLRRRCARRRHTRATRSSPTILRASHKPVLVLANKIDDPRRKRSRSSSTGSASATRCRSRASTATARGDLLDEIVALPAGQRAARRSADEAIRVAILGRPNVGKSSLFNRARRRGASDRLRGAGHDARRDRHRRSQRGDTTFVLVDTAGLRRKRKQRQGIDYYSELRALEAAERADVALVLIDASRGDRRGATSPPPTSRARRSARRSSCCRSGTSPTVTIEEVRPELQRRLRQRPPFITVSAKSGRGVARLLDKVAELFDKYAGRIPTAELNRFLGELREARPGAVEGQPAAPEPALRRAGRASRPPRFRFTVNDPSLVTRDYGYWVENELRERFELEGVPVAIDFRKSEYVKRVVVGGGAWGTAFSRSAARPRPRRDARLPRPRAGDAIAATGRNPRYLPTSTSTASRATLDDAPFEDADLVVLAVPSARSARSSRRCPGRARC